MAFEGELTLIPDEIIGLVQCKLAEIEVSLPKRPTTSAAGVEN